MSKFKILLGLSIIQLAPLFCWDAFIPIMPELAKKYSIHTSMMSYGISLFALSYVIFSQISSFIIDKYSTKITVPLCLFLSCGVNILIPFANNFYLFLFLRILLGALLSVTICINALVNAIYEKEESIKIFAYLTSFSGIGLAIAPVIGSQLSKYFGMSSVFIFQTIYCLIAFFYYINIESNLTKNVSINTSFSLKDIFLLLKNIDLLYSSQIRILSYIPHFVFVTFSSILILDIFKLSLNQYSFIMFILGLSCIIGGYLSKLSYKKFGIHKTTFLGGALILTGASFLMLLLSAAMIARYNFLIVLILLIFVIFISIGRTFLSPFISKIIVEKCSTAISSASSLSMVYTYFISAIISSILAETINLKYNLIILSFVVSILLIYTTLKYFSWKKKQEFLVEDARA